MILSDLKKGQSAKIVSMDLDKDLKHRLDGFGIIIGSDVKTYLEGWGIKIYDIRGSLIALRDNDASRIYVKQLII